MSPSLAFLVQAAYFVARKSDPRYRDTEVPGLIDDSLTMTNQLLDLCDYPIKDDRKTLGMQKQFPDLFKLAPSRVIIPLQESLTANFPPTSSSEATHQPFPLDAPTFECLSTLFFQFFFTQPLAVLHDEIEIMRSLAKPRKITIRGSDGKTYVFLGKPKDDLRKDARLMDFNGMINKLLKANSDSRRRKLCEFFLRATHNAGLICRRYPHLRCRHPKRGVWVHTMGI